MNVHDSERLAGLLDQAGYEPARAPNEADLVVINTCSVRERAEDRLYTELGMVPANTTTGKRPIVAVTGCVAQQEGSALLERGRRVDLVVGTQALTRLPEMVDRLVRDRPERVDINPYDNVSFPLGVARRSDPVKASVTIIEGCNDFCAFCVVPYTRGHERMRPAAEIVEEVRLAAAEGHREIHLLGQIVNHYAAPDRTGCDFAGLLELVHEVRGVERIRFASPHPRHVSGRMIAVMRSLPKVCCHLHLPVQSGSTSVLARMRRRHTRDDYLQLVERLRTAMPDIALSTDMIVGFPGEPYLKAHDILLEEYDFDVLVSGHEQILATKDHLKTNKEFTLDVMKNAIKSQEMVDFTQIAQEYGSLGRYAVLDALFDTQAQVCSDLTLKKWQEQLKELEPFMTDHCMAMLFYVGID